jgi:hypothetical protein
MIYYDGTGHLISDESLEELHAFAKKLGLKKSWFQEKSGRNYHPHYDLTTLNKREDAAKRGATYVSPQTLLRRLQLAPYMKKRGKSAKGKN